CQKYSNPPLTF
nr:immunoglobulin light chain junction region [Macaca mulatta]MOX84680.1 immunoglobulin light chain junction region [Macaca mulatta]MOX85160.1 immunoglobulin light chain junction region [Macaca mulatta]MOX85648.1 immunoglobulin light chain junction region [Macaca mulatta]MOX85850.1 immunoglobulin light chain junction region [Macaca mulatta]